MLFYMYIQYNAILNIVSLYMYILVLWAVELKENCMTVHRGGWEGREEVGGVHVQ